MHNPEYYSIYNVLACLLNKRIVVLARQHPMEKNGTGNIRTFRKHGGPYYIVQFRQSVGLYSSKYTCVSCMNINLKFYLIQKGILLSTILFYDQVFKPQNPFLLYKNCQKLIKYMYSLISIKFILISIIVITSCKSEKIVCYTKGIIQCQSSYRYLYGLTKGYYINIDPQSIYSTSILYLFSQGWNGLHLLSGLLQINHLNYFLPGELGLSVKISNKNMTNAPNLQNIQSAPIIPMYKICQKYFYQKPIFLTTDIQNIRAIISTNNWKSYKCRPQLIIFRKNRTKDIIQDETQNTLKEKGYIQMLSLSNGSTYYPSKLILNDRISVFVDEVFFDKYQSIAEESYNYTQLYPKNYISYQQVSSSLAKKVLNDYEFSQFFRMKKQGYAHRFFTQYWSINKNNINLTELVYSLRASQPRFLIMEFNPLTTKLIVNKTSYQYLGKNQTNEQFFHIVYTIFNYQIDKNKTKDIIFNIYIYDHGFLEEDQELNVLQKDIQEVQQQNQKKEIVSFANYTYQNNKNMKPNIKPKDIQSKGKDKYMNNTSHLQKVCQQQSLNYTTVGFALFFILIVVGIAVCIKRIGKKNGNVLRQHRSFEGEQTNNKPSSEMHMQNSDEIPD